MDRLKQLNILFLEDNLEFAKNTINTLNIYFKKIYHHTNIKDALEQFHTNSIDLIISDIKVEDGNGLEFITSLREFDENVPIIILSAYKDEEFLLKAIPLNLLSYELKPLSYNNFTKLLQKISKKFNIEKLVEISPNANYNFKTKKFLLDSKPIKLSNKEILFMELMLNNINTIVTNEQIQRFVWRKEHMSDAGLKNLIFRLRKKISIDFLENISSVGYRLSRKS